MTERTGGALSVGDEIELDITNIAHGGICVARHEGRVVFVADTIPGERVVARITEARKKSFARAEAVRVIDASEHRRDHVWAEASISRDPDERVGGAEFGHIALAHQRSLKEAVLRDSMTRFGKLDAADPLLTNVTVEAAPGDDESNGLGWRTRVRLHIDADTGIAGPYAVRSRTVIPVDTLPLANETVNQIAPLGEYMPDVLSVDVVAPSGDDPRLLISHEGTRERVGERDLVREFVDEREFLVRAGGFWQVHREAPLTLFEAVRDTVASLASEGRFDPGASNLDLYGGAGLLTAAVLEGGGTNTKVTSVEADSGATDDAAENLADFVGVMAVTARVDRFLADTQAQETARTRDRMRQATVVLDPPRSGAGGKVTAALASLAPANLIYVACDPVALARDTAELRAAGYDLRELRAFDLFPHTHHFESLAVFTRGD